MSDANQKISFKERVREIIIKEAKSYKEIFVDLEDLIDDNVLKEIKEKLVTI